MARPEHLRFSSACLLVLCSSALAWAGPGPGKTPAAEKNAASTAPDKPASKAPANAKKTDEDRTPASQESAPDRPQQVVKLKKSIDVYTRPAAERRYFVGTITRGSRVAVLEQKSAKGCKGKWLRVGARAWLCSRATRPTDEAPGARSLTDLDADSLLPRDYVVTRDVPVYSSLESASQDRDKQKIRGLGGFIKGRSVRRNGQRFVKTPHGWVPASKVQSVKASSYQGVPLSPVHRGKRLAFVRVKRARLYDQRGERLKKRGPAVQTYLGEIGEPVVIEGRPRGKKKKRKRATEYYPLGDGTYLHADDISIIEWLAAPAEVARESGKPAERWIDVSVSRQLLVAYEGEDPVMATLVSTGRTATTPGVYRIQKKRAYGRLRAKPEYRTQWDVHVPWVMTLDGRLAMHTVYWHENFGQPFSQGCVNLAPIDAKWLWDFTEPTLPAGWVRVMSDDQSQGTVVRIRK